ncbi:hypothetical protein C8R46DRAFT_981420, partial [Mycena filopes]
MSVTELEARIDQLSANIQRLERSRSAAQQQLNALRDPVGKLPLELSSEIFLHCLPRRSWQKPRAGDAPQLFLNISARWSNIALSTPALWSTIHLDFNGADALRSWLGRARNYPLSISLRGALDGTVGSVIRENSQQIRNLEIGEARLDQLYMGLAVTYSALRTIRFRPYHGAGPELSIAQIISLLRLAPNVIECIFDDFPRIMRVTNSPKLALPRLTLLKLKHWQLLKHITLPALQTLSLEINNISDQGLIHANDELLLFFQRSLPTLRKLVIETHYKARFAELERWLRLVPSLRHVELIFCPSELVDDLLTALVESADSFLPHLAILKIKHSSTLPAATFRLLAPALSARRSRLVYFELQNRNSVIRVGEEVAKSLRLLAAADGVHGRMSI